MQFLLTRKGLSYDGYPISILILSYSIGGLLCRCNNKSAFYNIHSSMTTIVKRVIFKTENFAQEAKSEFRRILISKSAYFEVRMDFK